ncbi:MAG TPA: exosortase family protein XrtF [Ohtaekwangia sp.]
MNVLHEFRPAFIFLGKFLGIYIAGNLLYGVFVESFGNQPDVVTSSVSYQASVILSWFGEQSSATNSTEKPTVLLQRSGHTVISVYEGCNGINVMIVFIAFVLAFSGKKKMIVPFIGIGLLILHISNLIRILLLYYVAISFENYFYFVHKYLFTAALYVVVFVLWAVWIIYFNERSTKNI